MNEQTFSPPVSSKSGSWEQVTTGSATLGESNLLDLEPHVGSPDSDTTPLSWRGPFSGTKLKLVEHDGSCWYEIVVLRLFQIQGTCTGGSFSGLSITSCCRWRAKLGPWWKSFPHGLVIQENTTLMPNTHESCVFSLTPQLAEDSIADLALP